MKAEFAEEITLRGLDKIAAVVEIAQPVAQLGGQFIQAVEPRIGLKARRIDGGQFQGGVVQPSFGGIFLEQMTEMICCGHLVSIVADEAWGRCHARHARGQASVVI